MVKEFYRILEITETATAEEIKKAYRKLAVKWHPDKFATKSLDEKQEANKKMQEINKAFEILGNEELRKKYDWGETEFTSDYGGYDYEAEIKEGIRRKEEELRRAKNERIDIELEINKMEMKALDRSSTINGISAAFSFTYPRVFKENLDSRLWEGYQDWMEKVVKMEITIPRGQDRSEELRKFKEEMVRAIKEAEINLGGNQESKKRNWTNDRVGREKKGAVEMIEELMNEKGLKAQDLGEYSNYQDQISNLNKTWEIHELRDKIMEFINNWRGKTSKNDRTREGDRNSPAPTPSPNKPNDNNQKGKVNYRNLNREELINAINQKDLENDSLKEIITALEIKVEELEEEIKELKAEVQTPEIQEETRRREDLLKQVKEDLKRVKDSNPQNPKGSETENKEFPTGLVIGGGVVLVVGLATLFIIKNKKKKKL